MARTTHRFEVDPAIIEQVIKAQSGTREKALIELAMNSADAGASRCEIEVTGKGFVVKDDGKGFQSEEEIKKYFGRFGTPHEDGDAIYGRFRIGRGQIMALAQTMFASGHYRMTTDIENRGLGYDFLVDKSEHIDGCTVVGKWYEPITKLEVVNLERTLKHYLKYFPIPVFVNGEKINSETKWTHEDDNAFYRLNNGGNGGGIRIYNQGVYVTTMSSYSFGGISGTVNTKKPLMLNTARNDVRERDCPVWKEIKKFINKASRKEINRMRMDQSGRMSIMGIIRHGGAPYEDIQDYKFISFVGGKKMTLSEFVETIYHGRFGKDKLPITIEPEYDNRQADIMVQRMIAGVISHEVAAGFEVEANNHGVLEILQVIRDYLSCQDKENADVAFTLTRINDLLSREKVIEDFAELSKDISGDYIKLKDSELDKKEAVALRTLRHVMNNGHFMWAVGQAAKKCLGNDADHATIARRKIVAGSSQIANGWTDGRSYIAINRDVLRNMHGGVRGVVNAVMILLHEICHTDLSTKTNNHGLEFYQLFHELCHSYAADAAINLALSRFPKERAKAGIKSNTITAKMEMAVEENAFDETTPAMEPTM